VLVGENAGIWIVGRPFYDEDGAYEYSTNWLMWEANNINYAIYSNDLTLAETLKVAESITP
jgi:hypothetical protein